MELFREIADNEARACRGGPVLHEPQITTILSPDDPDPVEIVNRSGSSEFVLTCEHAGRAIPAGLNPVGVSPDDMNRHIAWDIGAGALARAMAARMDAPLVLQRYSRLIVDCNRPFDAPDCFPEISDGTGVPVNRSLSHEKRSQRFAEIHRPLHDAIGDLLDEREKSARPTVLVSVHSFTPVLAGVHRPWLLGALANRDKSFATAFLTTFLAHNKDVTAALNVPYTVDDFSDYTVPVHGEKRGLPHVLLEIRNDQIGDAAGQALWAERLTVALRDAADAMKDQNNVS